MILAFIRRVWRFKELFFIVILMCFLTNDAIAGGANKIITEGGELLSAKFSAHLGELFRFFGLFSVLVFIKSVSWTKMTLGGVLSLLGAFLFQGSKESKEHGEVQVKSNSFAVIAKGGLRVLVIACGVVLITGAVLEGFRGVREQEKLETTQNDPLAWLKKIPSDHGIIGVSLSRMKDGRPLITGVLVNSPAEAAGLLAGDAIETINGLDSRQISLKKVTANMSGYPGTYLILKVKRNGIFYNYMVERISGVELYNHISRQRGAASSSDNAPK
jgi:membrane-associated protease RseP (regulator of RpoE activity)